jgi:hypothetical protein
MGLYNIILSEVIVTIEAVVDNSGFIRVTMRRESSYRCWDWAGFDPSPKQAGLT